MEEKINWQSEFKAIDIEIFDFRPFLNVFSLRYSY